MKHYNHIIRFCILLVLAVVGFFSLRALIIPDSFGVYGSYSYGYHRGDSDAEQASRAQLFQGPEKCKECHLEQFEPWKNTGHSGVSCETCHGHWSAHNNNTKDTVPKDTSIEACLLCHQTLEARPASFPQIKSFEGHVEEQEVEMEPGMQCVECHDPHEPM
jgi:hypothetical protein